MFKRGSKRAKANTKSTGKYRRSMIEQLETRRLLTTLVGGGPGQVATYFYRTEGTAATAPTDARIDIYGDVIAEFIFTQGGGSVVRNFDLSGSQIGTAIPPGDDPTTGQPEGGDLFAIYVSKADINSYISVTEISPSTREIQPFGSGRGFDVRPANSDGTRTDASPGGGAGGLILGTSTGGQFDAPVIKVDINGAGIGVRPAGLDDTPEDPQTDLSAGLRTAPGVDLGKFLFGGTVVGKVRVEGSMNLFYAGWIVTGDARGAGEGTGASGLPQSFAFDGTTPDPITGEVLVPRQNFYIGGDLQNLATVGPIGWDGTFGIGPPGLPVFFLSGTDIYVRGRIGQIQANGGSAATVTALNLDPAAGGFTRPVVVQEEIEGFNHFPGSGVVGASDGFANTPTSDFTGGVLRQPATGRSVVPFTNDNFDQFQFLGAFSSPTGNDIAHVRGTVQGQAVPDTDPNDYYGVALLAGQRIRVQLLSTGNSFIGVFDPDGRQIASDYSNLATPRGGGGGKSLYTFNRPFEFVADRPGIYRFAIGQNGDVDFAGAPNQRSLDLYELTITNIGNLAIGGIKLGTNVGTGDVDDGSVPLLDVNLGQPAVQAQAGDLGGIYVQDRYYAPMGKSYAPVGVTLPDTITRQIFFGSVYVPAGNLRAVDASSIGIGGTGAQTFPTGVDLNVPSGNVGLIQTRGVDGIMELNPSIPDNFSGNTVPNPRPGPSDPVPFTPDQLAIGGSYQVINAANRFTGGVNARGGMGILRAGSITRGGMGATYIHLDTDDAGFDGKSDLIEAAGALEAPILIHGTGGNFRYLRAGVVSAVDSFFGGTDLNQRVVHDFGASVNFTDDSGSAIVLTPVGRAIPNPNFNPLDPLGTGPQIFYPQLSTRTYPVRSGGVIVMDVQSTGSIQVNATAGSLGGTAEIGRLEVHGSGAAPTLITRVVRGRPTGIFRPGAVSTAIGNELSVVINGSAVTDVAYIVGMAPEPDNSFYNNFGADLSEYGFSEVSTFGNLTHVINNTGGEILGINATTLGVLQSRGSVGVAKSTIPYNSVNFINTFGIGAAYAGSRTEMPTNPAQAGDEALGLEFPFNRQTYGLAIFGDIGSIASAQAIGNVVAVGVIGSVVANSDRSDIPGFLEGIVGPVWANGGSGTSTTAIESGTILSINVGEGLPSSGSGDFARTGIFASNVIQSVVANNADIRGTISYGRRLDSLVVNGGSIVDANILNLPGGASAGTRESSSGLGGTFVTTPGGVEIPLGSVVVTGAGQGIIGTMIHAHRIGSISVPRGFGIISSYIIAGANNFINSITAAGYGIRDTRIVAGSDLGTLNVTGNGSLLPTSALGTSVRTSEFVRVDPLLFVGFDPDSGRAITPINDIHAALGTSPAAPSIPGVTDTGVIEDVFLSAQRGVKKITAQTIRGPLTQFSVGNVIGTLQTRGLINGLRLVTGRIGKFAPASDVLNLQMTISGPLSNVRINGTLGGNSLIEAIGPNGTIGNVSIRRDLDGEIRAAQSIGNVSIGGNLNGTLRVDALNRSGVALNKLVVNGTIANGSLLVGSPTSIASVGTIIVGGALGASSADQLNVSGGIQQLRVGGPINLTLNVGGNVGSLQAAQLNGPATINADLVKLVLTGNEGTAINAPLTVAGQIRDARVNGSVNANVEATAGIGRFVITNGNTAAGTTMSTANGSIDTLQIVNGNLFGGVTAANGLIRQIVISGNVGDGTTPLQILTNQLDLLSVGGSIRNGATVRVNGPLGTLVIGQNLEAGATIIASTLGKQQIGGEVLGTFLIG